MMWRYTISLPASLLSVLMIRADAQACTQSILDACLAPMAQYDLENTATIVLSHYVVTMGAICNTFEGVRACMEPLLADCHSQTRAEWTGIDQSYHYICDEAFDEYARHQACFAQPSLHSEADKSCNQTFHQQVDSTSNLNQANRTTLICQYVTLYFTCIHDVVNATCGEEAAHWQLEFDQRIHGPSLAFIGCPLIQDFYSLWPQYEAMSAQVEITTASAVDEFTEYETISVLVEIANTSSASQWNALVLILVCCITGAIV